MQNFTPLFGSGEIPGYLTDGDIEAIAELSTKLPGSGNFIEVGSFLGKSAVEWAKNLQEQNKNCRIICIDSYNTPMEILHTLLTTADFIVPKGNTQLELFNYYTQKYANIRPLKTFFNQEFVFDYPIAGIFEDSDHQQSTLSYALPFWWKKLSFGGILSGHDYNNPDVQTGVDLFALLHDLEIKTFENSSIWYIEEK